jgi:ribulose-5-phosphate 4-epimerase/fuculose-1-phosphate aldolase
MRAAGVTNRELAERLTLGCRILAEQGILDAYGHLSARLPDMDGHFLINRGMSPALVTPDDFIVMDQAGKVVEGDGQPNVEWPIHACIYAARPDVASVLHSHDRLSRIFILSRHKLRGLLTSSVPEWQSGVPIYRGAGLVTTLDRGNALARVLGAGSAALLRGHGNAVVSGRPENTVMKAIILKSNADVLHELLCQGVEPELWSDEEAAEWRTTDGLGGRAWDYYEARAAGRLFI